MAAQIQCALARLPRSAWLPNPAEIAVDLIADGVYHANFSILSADQKCVARVVRESQWGLHHSDQLEREYAVLSDLAEVDAAPKPCALVSAESFHFMVQSFVPGRYIDHKLDLEECGAAISEIHACTPSRSRHLLDRTPPKTFLLSDSGARLRRRRAGSAGNASATLLEQAIRHLSSLELPTRTPTLTHTDLIQKNLLFDGERCRIVDWEGARLGSRAWDLAYFVSPVTLAWADPAVSLTPGEKEKFLSAYAASSGESLDALRDDIDAFMPFVLLRALSWCVAYASHADPAVPASTQSRLDVFTSEDFIGSAFERVGIRL